MAQGEVAFPVFRLLGSVQVGVGPGGVGLGPRRQRLLLAVLLAEAGRVVSAEGLVDRLWDGVPPRSARSCLQSLVSGVRGCLRGVTDAVGVDLRVERGLGGYLLDVDPLWVDLHLFRHLVACADAGSGEAETADLLGRALELWRGVPLDGLPGCWAERTRHSVGVALVDVLVRWVRFRVGSVPGGVVVERITRHLPHLRACLDQVAPADRGVLEGRVEEVVGLLQAAQSSAGGAVSSGGVAPSGPVVSSGSVGGQRPASQLPRAVHPFVGRDAELGVLDDLLVGSRGTREVTSCVVTGPPGVGKTALAVQWAYRVAGEFPDGQLYVDLRGYDPDHRLEPGEALAGLLRTLGVPDPAIPFGLAERAAEYRSRVAGRRLLVIADNAGDCEQVRLLLPGTPSGLLVATSRDALGELVARDGAHRITLDLLSAAEAAGLLGDLVGERACGEPEAVGVLVEQCSRLPLALRVAAELAVSRPDVSLGALVVELSDEEKRLGLMVADGDPRAGVEAVFSWSYRQLPERTARTFRRVGLHPGPSWGVCAAAALAGVEAVAGDLGVLVRAHLVQEVGPGRFVMHDLLRAYARGLVARADTEPERAGAVTALLDHVVASAACALDPSSTRRRPPRPTPSTTLPLPEISDAAGALGWLAVERPALVRLVVHAADNGWPAHAMHLAEILSGHLESGGHLVDALMVHEAALRAARAVGDLVGQAHALVAVGAVLVSWGRYEEGARRLEEAAACARRCGDAHLEARALTNASVIAHATGRCEEAIALQHRALPLWRRTDDRLSESRALYNLGVLESARGRPEEGLVHLESARAMALRSGDRRIEAEARDGLGTVLMNLGRHAEAAEHLEVALEIWREWAVPEYEAQALARLGVARTRLGRPEEALDLLQAALDFHRRSGFLNEVTIILNSIGIAHRVAGRPEEAAAWHTEALATAEDLNSIPERARAHDELGLALTACGRDGEARSHWEKALALYEELRYPQARDVARRLADPPVPGTDVPEDDTV